MELNEQTILSILKQSPLAICLAVMTYIVLSSLRDIQKELQKISEIIAGLVSMNTAVSEQIGTTVSRLLEILERKVK